MLYVFKVNVSKDIDDKIVFIEYIIDRLTAINLLLRISTDLKLISPAQFGNISIMAVNVLKQAQGWLKYYRPLTSKHV